MLAPSLVWREEIEGTSCSRMATTMSKPAGARFGCDLRAIVGRRRGAAERHCPNLEGDAKKNSRKLGGKGSKILG